MRTVIYLSLLLLFPATVGSAKLKAPKTPVVVETPGDVSNKPVVVERPGDVPEDEQSLISDAGYDWKHAMEDAEQRERSSEQERDVDCNRVPGHELCATAVFQNSKNSRKKAPRN